MRPLKHFVLVEEIDLPDKIGEIIVPDTLKEKGPVKKGRVLDIGPNVDATPNAVLKGYGVGSVVLYHAAYRIPDPLDQKKFLVPDNDIIGIDSEKIIDPAAATLMPLPDWDAFCEGKFDSWAEYANIRIFQFRLAFLNHTVPRDALHRVIYEHCCQVMMGNRSVEGNFIKLSTPEGNEAPDVKIQDDKYDATFALMSDALTLRKTETSMQNLVETLPSLMRVFASLLKSPEFRQVLGQDCQRVTSATLTINQHIRLTGRGKDKESVRNWEVMKKLLRLETESKEEGKTLFGLLGPKGKALGRSDVTIGFEKEIKGHLYQTFVEVQAPENDQSRLLTINWQVQDHLPGLVADRDYSDLFTTFFRNTVLCQFYREWFKDVHCTTLGNK